MTKLPKIERCVCGAEAVCVSLKAFCDKPHCWIGPTSKSTDEAILAWNRVMSAAKKAKVSRAK